MYFSRHFFSKNGENYDFLQNREIRKKGVISRYPCEKKFEKMWKIDDKYPEFYLFLPRVYGYTYYILVNFLQIFRPAANFCQFLPIFADFGKFWKILKNPKMQNLHFLQKLRVFYDILGCLPCLQHAKSEKKWKKRENFEKFRKIWKFWETQNVQKWPTVHTEFPAVFSRWISMNTCHSVCVHRTLNLRKNRVKIIQISAENPAEISKKRRFFDDDFRECVLF